MPFIFNRFKKLAYLLPINHINQVMKRLLFLISFLPSLALAQTSQEYLYRANDLAKQKKYTEAIADFTQSIKKDTNNTKAYLYRGNAYTNLKDSLDNAKAIADFTQVLRTEPRDGTVYFYRANAYASTRDYADAIKDFTTSIELGYKKVDIYH